MSKKSLLFVIVMFALCTVPVWGQSQLPPGPGRTLIQANCNVCHTTERIFQSNGYNRAGWKNLVEMMVNGGSPLPRNKIDTVVNYLTKNFPEKPLPPAVVIPGPVKVSFKVWNVPTPGSRPHDPAAAPDGSLWYAGQFANALGRVNPKTGKIQEFHPLIAHSGPHAIIPGKNGDMWFTANFKGYIGKFDPKTDKFTEYHMPNPKARDPHTIVFDQHGTMWFTVQGGDFVGRLIPNTGQITLIPVPTPRARPYGMVVNSKGIPYFAEFGSNKIGAIDTETMKIHEFVLPNPKARPRRIAVTPDDMIWYTDYARGYLGRLDPETGKVEEWPSPGGPKSQPYGMTTVGDIVWYSESGVKPNTLVRFDPKTDKFQTWKVPGGGGVVRNMAHFANGNLAMACSGVNQVALVVVGGEKMAMDRSK